MTRYDHRRQIMEKLTILETLVKDNKIDNEANPFGVVACRFLDSNRNIKLQRSLNSRAMEAVVPREVHRKMKSRNLISATRTLVLQSLGSYILHQIFKRNRNLQAPKLFLK
jgi:hypothetical protein